MKVKNFYGDETFFTILDETFFQADENLKMKMKAFKLFKCEMKIFQSVDETFYLNVTNYFWRINFLNVR